MTSTGTIMRSPEGRNRYIKLHRLITIIAIAIEKRKGKRVVFIVSRAE